MYYLNRNHTIEMQIKMKKVILFKIYFKKAIFHKLFM
jgi:hypothetical protein